MNTTQQPPDVSRAEAYLAEVDDHLIALLDDPFLRLGHLEEAAQLLLDSGTDPVEEFGPPATYAQTLAESIGRPKTPRWVRGIAMTLGFMILLEGLAGALNLISQIDTPDIRDFQTTTIGTSIVAGFFLSVSMWVMFSPHLLRLQAKLYERRPLWRYGIYLLAFIALALVMMGANILVIDTGLEFAIPTPSIYVPIVAACIAAGGALTYISKIPWICFRLFGSSFRPDSVLRYNPFAIPRIRYRTTQPSPNPPNYQTVPPQPGSQHQ